MSAPLVPVTKTAVLQGIAPAAVYAVDVGKGQLHWKLRQDPRVTVRDELNARHLRPSDLPEQLTNRERQSLLIEDAPRFGLCPDDPDAFFLISVCRSRTSIVGTACCEDDGRASLAWAG